MHLFGPSRTMSFGGNYYALIIVDDYSRFTWTLFLTHKKDVFHAFKKLAKIIQNKKISILHLLGVIMEENLKIRIWNHFVMKMTLNTIFLHLEPPQQNKVVERKNRSLEKIARTLHNDTNLSKYLWAEAVNIACYIMNRALIRPILKKIPYELYKGRKTNISHLYVF